MTPSRTMQGHGRVMPGFTLLEVLIGLAVLSVILAALYSSFFISQRAVDAVDTTLLRQQESRAAVDTIRREIESAVYDNEKTYTVFRIEDRDLRGNRASRLTFTAFPRSFSGPGLITYIVEEDGNRLVLLKGIVPAWSRHEGERLELVEGIESFEIEARYKDEWVKAWDSGLAKALPDEVRVSLTVRTGGEGEAARTYTVYDIARPRIGRPL